MSSLANCLFILIMSSYIDTGRTRTYVVAIDYYPALFNQNIGYKSLAPIYFRNSNAAVIVYDITQVSDTLLFPSLCLILISLLSCVAP